MTFTFGELVNRGQPDKEQKTEDAAPLVCARTNKIRHADKQAADEHIRKLKLEGDAQPERLNRYRCWSCADWHVGHKTE